MQEPQGTAQATGPSQVIKELIDLVEKTQENSRLLYSLCRTHTEMIEILGERVKYLEESARK